MKIFKRPRIEFLPEELAALKRAEEQINEYHSEQIDLMRQELNEIVNGGSEGMEEEQPTIVLTQKEKDAIQTLKSLAERGLFETLEMEWIAPVNFDETKENEFHNVQNPKHYHSKGLDPITVMKQTFSKEELRGFFRGNVLKYEMRYQEKGGVTDLEKAAFYLRELIELENDSE